MKISLNQFKNKDSLLFSEEISPEDLDLDIGIMHFPDNLEVKAEAWKEDNDLTVQVHVEGAQDLTCSLCLTEFNNLFEKDFTLHYDIKGLESVSLDSDIREEIMMEHPIRVLCKSGCRGLCQFCGANLNEEKCGCQASGND